MSEILAPAGDAASAYAAINAGADAVYLGLTSFSARSGAANFGFDELKDLCAHAHAVGVKIYVAMNTLVKDSETEKFLSDMSEAWNAGADAFIMQDMYLGKFVKRVCPQITLHLSTQAGVNNVYGARLAKECGFDRVILARETRIEDIREIAKIIETEVFVQGALCTCFSGQCYFSSFVGGNSGNRGKCKQPCRKKYSIDRAGFDDEAYRLSLSDLSVGERIEDLIAAGAYSFKIEGRLRRPEYVAAAVRYYKNILNGVETADDLSALKRTYNRGNYTRGLAFGQDKNFISSSVQGHIGEFVGVVKNISGKNVCLTEKSFSVGDGFKILREGKEVGGAVYGGETKGGFILRTECRPKNGDKAFITTDTRLNKRLSEVETRKIKTPLSARFILGDKAEVTLGGKLYRANFAPLPAEKRPTTEEDIKKCFDKTDLYPFVPEYGEIEISDGAFIPASALNAFRRETYADYYAKLASVKNSPASIPAPEIARSKQVNNKTAVIAEVLSGLTADIGVLKPKDYSAPVEGLLSGFVGEKFLYVPPFAGEAELNKIKELALSFDGLYCEGYFGAQLCRELGKKLFAGTGFNLSNALSVSELNADYVALSKELTVKEAKPLCGGNTFYLTAGDIKLMDLIYCPFGKTCKSCDMRGGYTLTDDGGRKFPLRRYKLFDCAFEVFNCVPLVVNNDFTGKLIDCSVSPSAKEICAAAGDADKLKKIFKNYTKGHGDNPVL